MFVKMTQWSAFEPGLLLGISSDLPIDLETLFNVWVSYLQVNNGANSLFI